MWTTIYFSPPPLSGSLGPGSALGAEVVWNFPSQFFFKIVHFVQFFFKIVYYVQFSDDKISNKTCTFFPPICCKEL